MGFERKGSSAVDADRVFSVGQEHSMKCDWREKIITSSNAQKRQPSFKTYTLYYRQFKFREYS